MKKIMFFAAMAASVAMVSCSKDQVVSSDASNPEGGNIIGFNSYSNINLSKGSSVENTNDFEAIFGATSATGFGVAAFPNKAGWTTPWIGQTAGGGQIKGNSTGDFVWEYADFEADGNYWPEATAATDDNALDFYAYAPFATGGNFNALTGGSGTVNLTQNNGISFTDYVVSTTNAEQHDLMYAVTENAVKGTNNADNKSADVTLNFQHALTQVRFAGRSVSDKVIFEVKSITLNNIYSTGDFTTKITTAALGTDVDDSATFTNNDGSWEVAATKADYAAPMVEGAGFQKSVILKNAADGSFVNLSAHTANDNAGTGAATTNANALILMPQNIEPWALVAGENVSAQNNAYLTIELSAYVEAAAGTRIYLLGEESTTTTGTTASFETVYIPFHDGVTATTNNDTDNVANAVEVKSTGADFNSLWQPGNRVTYNITFDGGYDGGEGPEDPEDPNLVKITFNAVATPWDDMPTTDVEGPYAE